MPHLQHRAVIEDIIAAEAGKARARQQPDYVVTTMITLSDGTKLSVGDRVSEDYRGRGERPDCFAREGTAAAKAALAAHAKSYRSRKPERAKPQRRPFDRMKHRQEAGEAKQAIDAKPLTGEIPRPAWAIGSTRRFTHSETAELRDGTSPLTVRLSQFAHDAIIEDVQAIPSHERGAGLVGILDRDGVRIIGANATSPAVRSGVNALVMDFDGDFTWARREQRTHGAHLRYVGSFHSHPHTNGDPSPADLRMWSSLAVETDDDIAPTRELHVGLIVGLPSRPRPVIEAFVIRRSGGYRTELICERAEIVR
jgi:hypothetical protein